MYSFIFEQTTIVKPTDLQILSESKTTDGRSKVAFKGLLQEAEVLNSNRRKYSKTICESIVSQLSPKAKSRNLLVELDHPMFFSGSGDPEMMKRRAAVIEVKNCCAVIRNIGLKGNQIIGELESLSGFKGPDFADLILKDKVNIGFSLRALGGVEPMTDGTLMVKSPIMPITYDVVSNPSHANARVMDILPESDYSILDKSESIMFEGNEYELLKEDDISVGDGNIGFARKFIDDIISENFLKVVSKQIQFKYGGF